MASIFKYLFSILYQEFGLSANIENCEMVKKKVVRALGSFILPFVGKIVV